MSPLLKKVVPPASGLIGVGLLYMAIFDDPTKLLNAEANIKSHAVQMVVDQRPTQPAPAPIVEPSPEPVIATLPEATTTPLPPPDRLSFNIPTPTPTATPATVTESPAPRSTEAESKPTGADSAKPTGAEPATKKTDPAKAKPRVTYRQPVYHILPFVGGYIPMPNWRMVLRPRPG